MNTNKTAEILYNKMIMTTPTKVAQASARIVNAIQQLKTEEQMLGIAATLICMLHKYDLNHVDVLGQADTFVYASGMRPEFKAIMQFMRDEWQV